MSVDSLQLAHPAVRRWFAEAFEAPTRAQSLAWPVLSAGKSALLLAPTGSGKTLAAFLMALDRLSFTQPPQSPTTRVLYVSPLKALGVDVERNLRAPLVGLGAIAARDGFEFHAPQVGVRSGDTPAKERSRLAKYPPDILITTPESLYLMLTSQARQTLAGVQTVIIDEIHSLCGTKRGAHLALSLERLEELRERATPPDGNRIPPLQRVGLSATQRPLDEIARYLGGATFTKDNQRAERAVSILDAGHAKVFDLRVEVPVEDMTTLAVPPPAHADASLDRLTGQSPDSEHAFEAAPSPRPVPSIWPSMTPRLLELIRSHRSTMLFVNSRRLAERLATALNDLAGKEVALAHHGSIAKDARAQIEDRLKLGQLPAIVATSSLELGIDMGAVDLVIQVEAPPSVASGIQRIGRAGHHVGEVSRGILFPKFRGDLLACAAIIEQTLAGNVEPTRYPRNPLDVLAQHVVSILVEGPIGADELYQTVRRAAPFWDLPRPLFDGVLDMLSGRYPSERFAELRARINWDRTNGRLEARRGARLLAVSNAGTIVDRGLYGVFIAGTQPPARVGELDEEMVFETRVGEVFLLGASSWRVEDISHDRVLVTPAPGEPARMPFWHGDKVGRPLELGRAIGKLSRHLAALDDETALSELREQYKLDAFAASNLVSYLREQEQQSRLPTDRRVVVEAFTDEVGDWRVVVLSPFGGRVHAPWCLAVAERLRREFAVQVDTMWADDGIVFRLPDSDSAPDPQWFVPTPEDAERLLRECLGGSALFSAHFRQNAARALLLPRKRPAQRVPLWVQRRRSADLLSAASEFGDFPILLETYRECLQDVFDLPGLREVLQSVVDGRIDVVGVTVNSASSFAASILFSYVGNFIYNGDAPLAERRAQALSLDHDQLRLLLGEPELRELLDPDAIVELERKLQRLDGSRVLRDADDLHDLLLQLGDLTDDELRTRCADEHLSDWLMHLNRTGRAAALRIAEERRWVAAEHAARYRDALGTVLPMGIPSSLLGTVDKALRDLLLNYASTHGPFILSAPSERYRLSYQIVQRTLDELEAAGLVVRGAFLPNGAQQEYCATAVLGRLKQSSLAKLRGQIEPVSVAAYARFIAEWQHLQRPLEGLDGVLSVIEQLQGVALPYSVWCEEVMPKRVDDFRPSDLDELCAAGEIVWRGFGQQSGDARLALYLTDAFSLLAPNPEPVESDLAKRLRDLLQQRGASFFTDLVAQLGGFPNEVFETLWELVLSGEVSNDTLKPVASLGSSKRVGAASAGQRGGRRQFRSRRSLLPGTEGRWSLLPTIGDKTHTERTRANAEQLIKRHGVLTRDAVRAEGPLGGFSLLYPVLDALEHAGRLRRGYFIAELGATQFAEPGAESWLRRHRDDTSSDEIAILSACDPANPWGATLPWPAHTSVRPQRAAGCHVVISGGHLLAYVGKGRRSLALFPLSDGVTGRASERDRSEALAEALEGWLQRSLDRVWLIEQLDGHMIVDLEDAARRGDVNRGGGVESEPLEAIRLLSKLLARGHTISSKGLQLRRAVIVSTRAVQRPN